MKDTGDTAGWRPVPALGEQTVRDVVRPSAVAAGENDRQQSPARSQAGSGVPTAVISPEAPADSLVRALARSMVPAPEFPSTTAARRLTGVLRAQEGRSVLRRLDPICLPSRRSLRAGWELSCAVVGY
jgi:hypothetical protein